MFLNLLDKDEKLAFAELAEKMVEADGLVRLAALRRLGVSVVPVPDLVVQEGDLLYLMVPNDRVGEFQAEWAAGDDGANGTVTS